MSKPNRIKSIASTHLPLVINVGFAGSRVLVDKNAHPSIDDTTLLDFEKQVAQMLTEKLRDEIQEPLKAQGSVFFCGISQVAIGGDFVFSEACNRLGWVQQIFLPQPRDAYLTAEGSGGPDFSKPQRAKAEEILDSPHTIQERLVSESNNRSERFVETNLEIVREANLIVALVRKDQDAKRGGTHQLIDLAEREKRPIMKVVVGINEDGSPALTHEWITDLLPTIPKLPEILTRKNAVIAQEKLWPIEEPSHSCIPKKDVYLEFLKDLGSKQAKWKRVIFERLALVILVTHLLATIIAVVALKLDKSTLLTYLISAELGLLFTGLMVHQWLHISHAVEDWALYRLLAEIARSAKGVGSLRIYFKHLFALPLPEILLPLLKTISILHLHDTRLAEGNWPEHRDTYLRRLDIQIKYHESNSERASIKLRIAQIVFFICSTLAIAATGAKLIFVMHLFPLENLIIEQLKTGAGFLAVLLPVMSVASLSLAAALDLNAKKKTSKDMLQFLKRQEDHLKNASSARELARRILQTESQLLGENVNWYARRAFVSIA